MDNSEDAENNMDSSCSSSSENDTDEFDSDIGEGTNIICSNSKYYQTKVVWVWHIKELSDSLSVQVDNGE